MQENNPLVTAHYIHFVGIGGIGISAIARMMLLEGKVVTGSDTTSSLVTEELEKLGVRVAIGHRAENISTETDLIIYTIAAPNDNPELLEGKNRGIELITYPEALGLLSQEKYTIAVSGTHGKTTTTAMLAKVLVDAGKEPTVIVGSFLKDQKSNFIAGNGPFVVEACEYKRSFLNLSPKILIITNIDLDHLDYYKDLKDIQSAFRELAEKVPGDGLVVTNALHPNILPILANVKAKVIDCTKEDVNIKLSQPGAHNIANAQAVISVSGFYGLSKKATKKSLENFSGTWRRFDYKGTTKGGALIYDDYAHHPKEVEASISGFRGKFPDKKLVILFQPHLFSRTKDHLDRFAEVLQKADKVLVLPIYAAREKDPGDITSDDLVKKMGERVHLVKNKEEAMLALHDLKESDVLVTMGAGDVYTIGENLLSLDSLPG